MERIERLEEELAHLRRVADDLSDLVMDQAERLAQLERRVQMLMTREAERDSDASGGVFIADQKPPHW